MYQLPAQLKNHRNVDIPLYTSMHQIHSLIFNYLYTLTAGTFTRISSSRDRLPLPSSRPSSLQPLPESQPLLSSLSLPLPSSSSLSYKIALSSLLPLLCGKNICCFMHKVFLPPTTWLQEHGLFICPNCLSLVATSHTVLTIEPFSDTILQFRMVCGSYLHLRIFASFNAGQLVPDQHLLLSCHLPCAWSVLCDNTEESRIKLFMLRPKCILSSSKRRA